MKIIKIFMILLVSLLLVNSSSAYHTITYSGWTWSENIQEGDVYTWTVTRFRSGGVIISDPEDSFLLNFTEGSTVRVEVLKQPSSLDFTSSNLNTEFLEYFKFTVDGGEYNVSTAQSMVHYYMIIPNQIENSKNLFDDLVADSVLWYGGTGFNRIIGGVYEETYSTETSYNYLTADYSTGVINKVIVINSINDFQLDLQTSNEEDGIFSNVPFVFNPFMVLTLFIGISILRKKINR